MSVTPRELGDQYRKFLRQHSIRSKALSEKHVRLAWFMAESHDQEKWRVRMETWNRTYPAWSYKHESNFRRDCVTAEKRVTGNWTLSVNGFTND